MPEVWSSRRQPVKISLGNQILNVKKLDKSSIDCLWPSFEEAGTLLQASGGASSRRMVGLNRILSTDYLEKSGLIFSNPVSKVFTPFWRCLSFVETASVDEKSKQNWGCNLKVHHKTSKKVTENRFHKTLLALCGSSWEKQKAAKKCSRAAGVARPGPWPG